MIFLGLWISLMTLPPASITYLVWAGVRAESSDRSTNRYRRGSVVFHSLWGMGLSLPGFLMAAIGGLEEGWQWVGRLLGVALLGCWTLAIVAVADRRVPVAIAWWPLATVIVSYTFYAVQSGSSEAVGNLSGYGIGLAAWLAVAANFMRAVIRFDKTQPATRALARYPYAPAPPEQATRS